MDRLSSNTPSRWRPNGALQAFTNFVIFFVAFLALLILGCLIWLAAEPRSAKRTLLKVQRFTENLAGGEKEAQDFAFSFEALRRDLKVLGQDKPQLRQVVEALCREQGLPVNLVWSVIGVESNFDPAAVSSAGAQGLMQLMPETADDLDVENPLDPYENVRGGIRYLSYLLRKYDGDVRKTLAAYNAGPGAVQSYGGMPPFPETKRYVEKVLEQMRQEHKTGAAVESDEQ